MGAVGPSSPAGVHAALLEYALSLPEAWEDHPWGESVVKVRKKIFVFLGGGDGGHPAAMTVKLPASAEHALSLPHATPTGYGLGRAGWVTIGFPDPVGTQLAGRLSKTLPALDVLTDWVEESYRAVAPKTLVTKLLAGSG